MANWRRISGVAGLAAGAVAAGAGAVLAAERLAVGRNQLAAPPGLLGGPRGQVLSVLTDDEVPLYAEIDEPSGTAQDAPITIIFCHGYTLNLDCWHFQRQAMAGYRQVFWDQRDHGRSGRSAGAPTIEQLGSDLNRVIATVAPAGTPVILVGHSMGGMTIMALAAQYPELFGTQIVGAALLATAAGGLDAGSPWMPGPIRPVLQRTLPVVLRAAATGYRAVLVERGRRVSGDLSFLMTRYIGFGDRNVNPVVVDFLEQMIRSTPIEVVANFGAALFALDMRPSLGVLSRIPTVVMAGEKDRLIAPALTLELAAQLPGAEMVWVPGAGHTLMLETPALVNDAITRLIERSWRGQGPNERSA